MPIVDLDRVKTQGRRFVDGFTPGQKAMTIIGVVAVVLAGMTFMRWASTPNYAPLFTGLSSADAGAVTQQLQSQGVKFKITGGGGTIMVPQQMVDKTRIDLSAKGIPSGGDSFSLLDKQGITTDQFTRNIDYQRALQGELSKSIQTIQNVQSASVTLTLPQDTVFVGGDQDKATAAVLVKTAGTLPDQAVQAIAHLVASSIPNMNVDDVTVADASGKVLHAPGMELSAGGDAQVQQKLAYEDAVQKKVSDMIAATLGPGHAAVTVAADLDMSKSQSHQVTNTRPSANGTNPSPTDVPIQQSTTNETLTQPASSATNGPLGVGNTNANTTGGNGSQNYNKTSTSQTNALDTNTVDATTPPGSVKHLAVSVLLDTAAVPNATDATNLWSPQIANAAGIQAARDGANAVQVKTIAFNKKEIDAAAPKPAAPSGNPMFDLIKHVLTFMIVGLILFFASRAVKRAEENRVPLRVPIDLRELEAGARELALEPAMAGAGGAVGAPAARKPLEPPPQTLEGEITELIERQPDEVAQTLRSWLADRRG